MCWMSEHSHQVPSPQYLGPETGLNFTQICINSETNYCKFSKKEFSQILKFISKVCCDSNKCSVQFSLFFWMPLNWPIIN